MRRNNTRREARSKVTRGVLCLRAFVLLACAAAPAGCAQDSVSAATALPASNVIIELRGHAARGRPAWRPRVSAARGSKVRYRISLFNPGTRALEHMRLRVRLPRGMQMVDTGSTPAAAFARPGTPVRVLPAGKGRDFRFVARSSRAVRRPLTIRVRVATDTGSRSAAITTRSPSR